MKHAFSLVELSIVLVILGLLTGGIIAGQSLIRAAELRSIVTQYEQYSVAVRNFQDKYDALPGDLSTATSIWGAAHATPATCRTTASTGTETCNGNDDKGVIDNAGSNESYRFWQHLSNAGFIEGRYSGVTDGSTAYSSTATNSPASKLPNSYWFAWRWASFPAGAVGTMFDVPYNNVLTFGSLIANTWPAGPTLEPEESWNLDTKIDDGKPAKGNLIANATGGLSTCTTASGAAAAQSADLTAEYLLSATGKTCAFIFRNQF